MKAVFDIRNQTLVERARLVLQTDGMSDAALRRAYRTLARRHHPDLDRGDKRLKIPSIVKEAWEAREGPVVLATVDGAGQPNAIYATCVKRYDDERIVVADNFFDKTRRNILAGSRGAVLFITRDKKAYQLKGILEYHEGGPVFEDMKRWNPEQHPGHAAAVLLVREIFSGAKALE